MSELVRRHMAIVEAKMQQNLEASSARLDRAAEQLEALPLEMLD